MSSCNNSTSNTDTSPATTPASTTTPSTTSPASTPTPSTTPSATPSTTSSTTLIDPQTLLENCTTEQELHERLSKLDPSLAITLDPRYYAQWTTMHQSQRHDLAFGLMYCRGEARCEMRTGVVCCGLHQSLGRERERRERRERMDRQGERDEEKGTEKS
ncbi:hypothetical protein BZA77DRAFT_326564 [Pyronema omphalodes]|nr:hypothetical protein BZA77DRAFT_326564 [Pyronema omphalodes]